MENLNVKIVKKDNIDSEDLIYFYNYLHSKDIKIVEDIKEANLIITFGGDGTILSLIPLLTIKNVPIFSVNYGKLGFVTKISKENAIEYFEEYLNGNYNIDKRELLQVNYKDKTYYALNEISILKSHVSSNLINVELYQENNLINIYKSDGIIVSTPTGSTAYSLSAGGPIIYPNLNVLCVVPLAPQNLSARSIIIEGHKKLRFKSYGRNDYVGLSIDGNLHFKLNKDDIVEAFLSKKYINLICINNDGYFDILKKKLSWS